MEKRESRSFLLRGVLVVCLLLASPSTTVHAEEHISHAARGESVLSLLEDPAVYRTPTPAQYELFGANAELYAALLAHRPLAALVHPSGEWPVELFETGSPWPPREIDCRVIDYIDIVGRANDGMRKLRFTCRAVVRTGNRSWDLIALEHQYGREALCVTRIVAIGLGPFGGRSTLTGCSQVTVDWIVPVGGFKPSRSVAEAVSALVGKYEFLRAVPGRDGGLAGTALRINRVLGFADATPDRPLCADVLDALECINDFYALARAGAPVAVLTETGHGWLSRRSCDAVVFDELEPPVSFECQVLMKDTDRTEPHLEAWIYTHYLAGPDERPLDDVAFDLIEQVSRYADAFGESWEQNGPSGQRDFTWTVFLVSGE